MIRAIVILLAWAWACSIACRAVAGPCLPCEPSGPSFIGWWNDRPLQPGEIDDHAPRIDVDGDGVTSRIVIAWERRAAGDGDTWLATSDDGGCSWDARAVSSGPEDDRAPDVAVSLSQGAIAVTFVRDGVVAAAVSLDGGRTFSPPQLVDPSAPADAGARPRLAMIPVSGALHLHVAWAEGGRLRLARSLLSGASGSWLAGSALSNRFLGFSNWTDVDVAADTRSRSIGADSAVTLVATGMAPASTTPEVFALRSNDAGATFAGNPEDALTADVPRRVSEARPVDQPLEGALDPVLDVSDDGSGEFYAWEATLYTDLRAVSGGCRADARAEEGGGPTTIADWNDGATADLLLAGAARSAAVAVIPNPLQRPPAPEAHLFLEVADPAGPGLEIAAQRSSLDENVAAWVLETCSPGRLTGVAPPRASGAVVAGSASADEDLSHVFVTWADTRDGGSSIHWKRTDTVVDSAPATSAGPGPCASGGGLLVTWALPPSPPNCDVDHVRVEYGRAPGIYDGSVEADATPTSLQIVGLVEGVTYFARVTVIDEACNEASAAEVSGLAAACLPVACPLPVAWTLRAAKRPTEDDVELAWEPPPSDPTHDPATSYDIYRSTTRARDGFELLANAPAPVHRDPGAGLPGAAERHFYLLVARNACGTSGDEPLP